MIRSQLLHTLSIVGLVLAGFVQPACAQENVKTEPVPNQEAQERR
jgi:hypothetical protein